MTVTDDPPGEKLFTAAELLEMVLAAYERGLTDAATQAGRDFWQSDAADRFRAARQITDARAMKERSAARYAAYNYPDGYDYRGGAVDWHTGLPQRSGCAWLRKQRTYALAGGNR
ncbi:hypothetical protein [Paractinoplanes maris]|uniref:hypothetical protein n=1 Tax=Paractinoplanes maris TaxID=1734446 RepID=UPI00201FE273|nr:hypothetical protein [Actinoplanes maris]